MKRFIFEGSSDDTFGTIGRGGVDYDNCASGEPITFRLTSGAGSLLVTGQYCPGEATGWQIGIARDSEDDDIPAPNWPMKFIAPTRPYTVSLQIDAPDDTTIELVAS